MIVTYKGFTVSFRMTMGRSIASVFSFLRNLPEDNLCFQHGMIFRRSDQNRGATVSARTIRKRPQSKVHRKSCI